MVRFIAIVASALSLLSFTRATAIEARNCEYFCPELDNDGNSLDTRTDLLTTFLCLYLGGSLSGCEYNTVTGKLALGLGDCPADAVDVC